MTQTLEDLVTEALHRVMDRAQGSKLPWTDEAFPLLREAFAQAEVSLTDEQREARAAAMVAMTAEDWDSFAVAMIRPVCPWVDGVV
jgi:hypothetical protein